MTGKEAMTSSIVKLCDEFQQQAFEQNSIHKTLLIVFLLLAKVNGSGKDVNRDTELVVSSDVLP